MIPGFDLISFIQQASVIGVMLVIFAETGLMIGFFLPGDSLLFTAGFLAAVGILPINIFLLASLLFVAAVIGNTTGYLIGLKVGPRIFRKPEARLFKPEYVERARIFYEQNGGKAITLSQFIPILRTFSPVVAGVSKMPFLRFIAFNFIGAVFWAGGVTIAGYYLGNWFHGMGLEIDQVLLPLVAGIIIISVLPAVYHIFKVPENRKKAVHTAKSSLSRLRKKK